MLVLTLVLILFISCSYSCVLALWCARLLPPSHRRFILHSCLSSPCGPALFLLLLCAACVCVDGGRSGESEWVAGPQLVCKCSCPPSLLTLPSLLSLRPPSHFWVFVYVCRQECVMRVTHCRHTCLGVRECVPSTVAREGAFEMVHLHGCKVGVLCGGRTCL